MRVKIAKTVDDFIAEVNRCESGLYSVGHDIAGEPVEPLTADICFDSAKWDFYPEANTKTLVLYSQNEGKKNGRILIRDVQGVEHVRGNEYGNAYAIIAGEREPKRYVFYLKNILV